MFFHFRIWGNWKILILDWNFVSFIFGSKFIVDNEKQLTEIKQIFENESELKFTFKKEEPNKMSHLEVFLERRDDTIDISFY